MLNYYNLVMSYSEVDYINFKSSTEYFIARVHNQIPRFDHPVNFKLRSNMNLGVLHSIMY